jgi:N-acyl-D-aspartate/D-glutamate deacylase
MPTNSIAMKAIMETAMKAGAMGMTTALIYPPPVTHDNELIEIAKVAGQYGGSMRVTFVAKARSWSSRSKKRSRLARRVACRLRSST